MSTGVRLACPWPVPGRLARRRSGWLWCGCVVLVAVIVLLGLGLGTPAMAPASVVRALLDVDGSGAEQPNPAAVIVRQVRAPRVVLGLACGAALGVAGLLLQAVLRNPLAGPELTGAAGGAALGIAVLVVALPATAFALYPVAAAMGALVATALCVAGAGVRSGPLGLALVGSAVSAGLTGLLVALTVTVDPARASVLLRYLFGSLVARGWREVLLCGPPIVIALAVSWVLATWLNVLRAGAGTADALGVRHRSAAVAVIATSGVLVAAATAAAGWVAWVGVLVPQATRVLWRTTDVRRLLPACAVLGAIVVAGGDVLARVVLLPVELPLGACTTAALLAVLVIRAGLLRVGLR
ncbi:MAG: FecCD family ABC transporter permease [Angustibacter sp.]